MANNNQTMHGAIAIVKVDGKAIGKMRNISWSEDFQRQPVKGLGTIFSSEEPVTGFAGQLSCDLMEIDFENGGVPGAINRKFSNVKSQVLTGGQSFEDQLVLDYNGIQIDIFKKIEDIIDPTTGNVVPKLTPFAVITRALIQTDRFEVSEGSISVRSQSFKYLDAVIYP